MSFVSNNDGTPHPNPGRWGEACPGQLRFDSNAPLGAAGERATDVQLTRLAEDEWTIEAGQNAVAACQDIERGEFTALGFYRLSFQVKVVCRGEC